MTQIPTPDEYRTKLDSEMKVALELVLEDLRTQFNGIGTVYTFGRVVDTGAWERPPPPEVLTRAIALFNEELRAAGWCAYVCRMRTGLFSFSLSRRSKIELIVVADEIGL